MMSKADTHVHTFYSGTTGYGPLRFPESITSPEQQVDNARKNGMSVVCITDHSEIKGALKAAEYGKRFDDIDVVVGDEIMTADGEIMAVQHAKYPVYGVQFHPESIMTPNGKQILKNFIKRER